MENIVTIDSVCTYCGVGIVLAGLEECFEQQRIKRKVVGFAY